MQTLSEMSVYIICSTKTGKIYIDENDVGYIFNDQKAASTFAENNKNTLVDGPRTYNKTAIVSQCYSAGAKFISFHIGKKEERFPIGEKDAERDYYNNTLNRVYSHLRHTHRKEYLYKLADERFIVPAKIEQSNTDMSVSILYAYAQKENESSVRYIAFTDMDEFNFWNSRVKGWNPLEVSYNALWRIGRHHGILLNPQGCRFELSREMLEEITKNKREVKNADNKT